MLSKKASFEEQVKTLVYYIHRSSGTVLYEQGELTTNTSGTACMHFREFKSNQRGVATVPGIFLAVELSGHNVVKQFSPCDPGTGHTHRVST